MGAASHVVAEIMNRGYARVQSLGRSELSAVVHVFGCHYSSERRRCREISLIRFFACKTSQQRVPHVPVSFDKTWHYDHSLPVENCSTRGLKRFTNCDNFTVLDMNVAARYVAQIGIHREHVRILQKQLTASRQRRSFLLGEKRP